MITEEKLEELQEEAWGNLGDCDKGCECSNCTEKGESEYYWDMQTFADLTTHKLKCARCDNSVSIYVRENNVIDNKGKISNITVFTTSWNDKEYAYENDEEIKEE